MPRQACPGTITSVVETHNRSREDNGTAGPIVLLTDENHLVDIGNMVTPADKPGLKKVSNTESTKTKNERSEDSAKGLNDRHKPLGVRIEPGSTTGPGMSSRERTFASVNSVRGEDATDRLTLVVIINGVARVLIPARVGVAVPPAAEPRVKIPTCRVGRMARRGRRPRQAPRLAHSAARLRPRLYGRARRRYEEDEEHRQRARARGRLGCVSERYPARAPSRLGRGLDRPYLGLSGQLGLRLQRRSLSGQPRGGACLRTRRHRRSAALLGYETHPLRHRQGPRTVACYWSLVSHMVTVT